MGTHCCEIHTGAPGKVIPCHCAALAALFVWQLKNDYISMVGPSAKLHLLCLKKDERSASSSSDQVWRFSIRITGSGFSGTFKDQMATI